MRFVIVSIIKFYQRIVSPVLPQSCRFYPTCSQYAREAVEQHGAGRGVIWLMLRILKCHPFHPGGHDPIIK